MQSVRATRDKLQRSVKHYSNGGHAIAPHPLKANMAVSPKKTKVTITGDKFNSFKTKIT